MILKNPRISFIIVRNGIFDSQVTFFFKHCFESDPFNVNIFFIKQHIKVKRKVSVFLDIGFADHQANTNFQPILYTVLHFYSRKPTLSQLK